MGIFDSVFPVIDDLFKTHISFRTILVPMSAVVLLEVISTTVLFVFGAVVYNFTAAIVDRIQVRVRKEVAL